MFRLSRVPRTIWLTIIGWAVILFVIARPMAAMFLVLLLPFVAVWFIYSTFQIWRKPEKRRLQLAKVGITLIALGILGGAHWYFYQSARSEADRIVIKLAAYKKEHIDGPAVSLRLNQFGHLKGVAQSFVVDNRNGDLAQFVVDGVG